MLLELLDTEPRQLYRFRRASRRCFSSDFVSCPRGEGQSSSLMTPQKQQARAGPQLGLQSIRAEKLSHQEWKQLPESDGCMHACAQPSLQLPIQSRISCPQ